MASGAAAESRTVAMQPLAVHCPHPHAQPVDHTSAAAQFERPLHLTAASDHDRPADLLDALISMDCAATVPAAAQPPRQNAQPAADQRQINMAEAAIQHVQIVTQAAKGSLGFNGAQLTGPAAASGVPEVANSHAYAEPVQAESPDQAQVNQASAYQGPPAAADTQEAPARPESGRTTLPGTATGQVYSQPGPSSEVLIQPSSAAAAPLSAAATGEAAAQPAAGSEEAAQPEVQPGPWRNKRKATSQSPCTTEPPGFVAAPTLTEGATADEGPTGDGIAAEIQNPSAEQSQTQGDSRGGEQGSDPAQDVPAWLQDQVTQLILHSYQQQ